MEFVCPNCHCRTQDPVAIDATDDEAYKQAIVANEEYTRNKNLHRLAASCIKETRIAWEIFTKKFKKFNSLDRVLQGMVAKAWLDGNIAEYRVYYTYFDERIWLKKLPFEPPVAYKHKIVCSVCGYTHRFNKQED